MIGRRSHPERAADRANAWLLRLLPLWPILVFPAALLLPGIRSFPFPSAEAAFSDIVVSHYPYAVGLKSALSEGRFPLWYPTILSGHPFAANPLGGIWYPFGWIALLFPLPLGFNLLVLAHLVWGGLGMFRLLQSEGLRAEAALFGGLAFAALPKLYAHYGAGHLTLLYAVPWTPWLLLAIRRNTRFGQGVILALIFLADPRWAAYAGALWFGYLLYTRTRRGILPAIRTAVVEGGMGFLLSAPLAIPLLEFARASTRSSMERADLLAFALPLERLLGLLFPDMGGYHEWMLYPGILTLLLAGVGIVLGRTRQIARFWIGAALISLVFSLGALPLLAGLPGMSLLRVPSRALFVFGMSISTMAAFSLDAFLGGINKEEQRRGKLFTAFVGTLGFSLGAGICLAAGSLLQPFAWGAGAALVAAVWLSLSFRFPNRVWLAGVLLIAVVDWGVLSATLVASRSPQEVFAEGEELAAYLARQPGTFRVYSPSYSLPQHTAARFGLELADGVDPMQIRSYAEFMERATGVQIKGYGVTIPYFETGDPSTDNRENLPDPALLGLLNVQYVAAEFDLAVNGLSLERQIGETRLYRNDFAAGPAWIETYKPGAGVWTRLVDLTATEILSREPGRIVIAVQPPQDEPARLVLSEISYPGWVASVGGETFPTDTAYGTLIAVPLHPDSIRVEIRYRPASVLVGLLAAFFGLLVIAVRYFRSRLSISR